MWEVVSLAVLALLLTAVGALYLVGRRAARRQFDPKAVAESALPTSELEAHTARLERLLHAKRVDQKAVKAVLTEFVNRLEPKGDPSDLVDDDLSLYEELLKAQIRLNQRKIYASIFETGDQEKLALIKANEEFVASAIDLKRSQLRVLATARSEPSLSRYLVAGVHRIAGRFYNPKVVRALARIDSSITE